MAQGRQKRREDLEIGPSGCDSAKLKPKSKFDKERQLPNGGGRCAFVFFLYVPLAWA
jgi:hypothetical protein